jgi:hypothetical protein
MEEQRTHTLAAETRGSLSSAVMEGVGAEEESLPRIGTESIAASYSLQGSSAAK